MTEDQTSSINKAVNSLPDKLTIGAITYHIKKCDELNPDKDGESLLGEFYESACRISILKSIIHSRQVVITVLHEVIHVLTNRSGFKADEIEEQYVSAIAYGIVDVLGQNPDFIDWIKRVLIDEANE